MNQTRFGLIAIALVAVGAAMMSARAGDRTAGAHGPEGRYADPIVVPGGQMATLQGAPPAEVSVWIWHHDAWARVLSQVDERDVADQYVAMEDGKLDANDEVVVVLGDIGAEAPDDAWPEGIGREHERAAVKVTDPRDADFAAWYYVFRSASTPASSIEPAVAWDPETREVRTAEYTIGLADQGKDRFIGVKRLSLYGDPVNLVDRLKIRGTLSALGFETPLNEETLIDALKTLNQNVSFDPVIFGPLRVVLSPGGGFAYANRFTFFGGFDALGDIGGGALPIAFKNARVSLDFDAAAAGAIYTDPNVPAGVTIDGQADAVPDAPVPAWREVMFDAGRLALVSDTPADGSAARVYYKDDGAEDGGDTGDLRSFGDAGVTAPDLASLIDTGFPGEAVVLPIGRKVTAEQLAANRAEPLVVTVAGGAVPPSATATTRPVSTGTPTRPATREPTPTRGRPVLLYSFYVPLAGKAWSRP